MISQHSGNKVSIPQSSRSQPQALCSAPEVLPAAPDPSSSAWACSSPFTSELGICSLEILVLFSNSHLFICSCPKVWWSPPLQSWSPSPLSIAVCFQVCLLTPAHLHLHIPLPLFSYSPLEDSNHLSEGGQVPPFSTPINTAFSS